MILTHETLIAMGFLHRDAMGKPVDADEEVTLEEVMVGEYVFTDNLFQFVITGEQIVEDGPTVEDIIRKIVRAAQSTDMEAFFGELFGTTVKVVREGDPYPEADKKQTTLFPVKQKATERPVSLFPPPKGK